MAENSGRSPPDLPEKRVAKDFIIGLRRHYGGADRRVKLRQISFCGLGQPHYKAHFISRLAHHSSASLSGKVGSFDILELLFYGHASSEPGEATRRSR